MIAKRQTIVLMWISHNHDQQPTTNRRERNAHARGVLGVEIRFLLFYNVIHKSPVQLPGKQHSFFYH
jgi:hypothetical protein